MNINMPITDNKKPHHRLLSLVLAALLILPGYNTATASTHASNFWQLVNPLPGIRTLYDVISVGTKRVAVGNAGSILTSDNGGPWQVQNSEVNEDLNGIVHNGSTYVVVGRSGIILTSTDAITWTVNIFNHPDSISDTRYRAVTWSADLNMFLAVGDSGIVARSSNGTNWIAESTNTGKPMLDVIWDNGNFIAVGGGTSTTGVLEGIVLTSSDGITWQKQSVGLSVLRSVIHDGTQYIIAGDSGSIYTSTTGTNNWNKQFVADSVASEDLKDLSYNAPDYVAVGNNGTILTTTDANSTWINQGYQDNTTSTLRSVLWDGIRYTVVGTNKILSNNSSNLNNLDEIISAATNKISGIAWNGSQYLAVSSDTQKVYSSSNGFTWNFSATSTGSAGNFNDLIWNEDTSKYVALENNSQIITSSDGLTWTAVASNIASNMNGISWNGSIYAVVGDGGNIQTSSNLSTWTSSQNTGYTVALNAITWDGNRFLVVSSDNVLLTSSDGNIWSRVQSVKVIGEDSETHPANTLHDLYGITWNGSQYIAVGKELALLLSEDGITWEYPVPPPSPLVISVSSLPPDLRAITWNETDKRFVVAGDQGAIIVSTGTDLKATISTSESIATESDTLTYTVGVENNGVFVSKNILLTIDFQSSVGFRFAGSNCSLAGSRISCTMGDLSPNSITSVNIGLAPSTSMIGGNMIVTANAQSDQKESLPSDNTEISTLEVQSLQTRIALDTANLAAGGGGGGSLFYLPLLALLFGCQRKIRC